jgi:hypothetical protein
MKNKKNTNKVYIVFGSSVSHEPFIERVFSTEEMAVDYVTKEYLNTDTYMALSYEQKKKEAFKYWIQEEELDLP